MPPVEKILPYKPKPVPFKEGLVARESKQNNFIATPLDFFKILYRQNSDEQIAVKMNQTLTAPVTAALVRRHRLRAGIQSRTRSEAAELNWKNNPAYRQERIIFLRSDGLKQRVKAAQDRIRLDKQKAKLGDNPERKLLIMVWNGNRTVDDIASEINVSKTVAYDWLSRAGVEFRRGRKMKPWVNKRKIVADAYSKGLFVKLEDHEQTILMKLYMFSKNRRTIRSLGEELNMPKSTVWLQGINAVLKLKDWLQQRGS